MMRSINGPNQASPFDLWLTRALRSMFDPVLHEPLPREFVALLTRETPPST